LDEALESGFDKIATGHYARIIGGGLYKWIDPLKDQSYFLAGLSAEQLSYALFPIGDLEKSRVREIAREAWLPNAERKDSQWICFVGKVNMMEFLEKKIQPVQWEVYDTFGNFLWTHKGVFYYTIGQRKWLDIWGQKEPIFVVKKDLEKNIIIVWTSKDLELYSESLEMHHINVLNTKAHSLWNFRAKCKIRYRQSDQECEVLWIDWFPRFWKWAKLKVIFTEPQRAIASGQICAVYFDDELVMSGIIA
jgi:tRNA-specific 2-thiouridylase